MRINKQVVCKCKLKAKIKATWRTTKMENGKQIKKRINKWD